MSFRMSAACLSLFLVCALGAGAQEDPNLRGQHKGSEPRTYTGPLVDASQANCGTEAEDGAPAGFCPVSMRTEEFGLVMPDGKLVKFDEGGNAKALEALRKSRKGSRAVFEYWRSGVASNKVQAHALATLTGDTLNVEAIRVE